MMGITSKHRHRRTTGGGKRWRKKNAHTERHESKSGMDTSTQNVRGASSGGMYPGSFRAGIYARNAAGNGKGTEKMIRCFLILTLAVMIKVAFDIHNHTITRWMFGQPKQGRNWNGFRKEKRYEEEKRSGSTEESATSENGN